MNIMQVQYVVETAAQRSFSLAAQRLFISQSALSQQVGKLEQELGYKLFIRNSHGLDVTPQGEIFISEAVSILKDWDGFCDKVKSIDAATQKQIKIDMGASIYTNNLLSPLIGFFESQPSLSVSFVKFLVSNDIMSALKIGSIDVALERVPDGFNDRSELYFIQNLFYEPRCILMSKDDPRASREYLTIDELADSPIISGSKNSPTDQRIRNFLAPLGNNLRISYRCDENASMANLVHAGKGISLGPKSFGNYYGIAAVPVYPEHKEPIQFVCLKESLNRQETRDLLDYITRCCREMNLDSRI